MSLLYNLFFDYTLRTVALGAATLGIFAGALGSFAVLRKQSLLGDAMSHAALPGVALAFLLTLSKQPFVLLLGAAAAGWVGTLLMMTIIKNTIVKKDAALGIILSVFFGFGVVLLTFIQKLPTASKAGLDTFLFGNAATLLQEDVVAMVILGLVCLAGLLFFWKEFKLISFNPEYAHSLGFPVKVIDVILTSLIVISIVIGLQTVGVVLMSAMIIAPAVAARQWTHNLGKMVMLAAFFGALAGVSGAITSSMVAKLPTGPTIVLIVSFIVMISLLFAPQRGLFWDWLQQQKNKKKIDTMRMMIAMFCLSESHTNPYHSHHVNSLEAALAGKAVGIEKTLAECKKLRWVMRRGQEWRFTPSGLKEAKKLAEAFSDGISPSN